MATAKTISPEVALEALKVAEQVAFDLDPRNHNHKKPARWMYFTPGGRRCTGCNIWWISLGSGSQVRKLLYRLIAEAYVDYAGLQEEYETGKIFTVRVRNHFDVITVINDYLENSEWVFHHLIVERVIPILQKATETKETAEPDEVPEIPNHVPEWMSSAANT